MNNIKGIGFCGIACCLCEDDTCGGCKNDGCKQKEWCKASACCQEKELSGCWECSEFPCDYFMFNKPRVRAFVKFIAEYGEEKFLNALVSNEKAGMIYHYEGQLKGDYDVPDTEEEIIKLIRMGLES